MKKLILIAMLAPVALLAQSTANSAPAPQTKTKHSAKTGKHHRHKKASKPAAAAVKTK